MSMVLRRQKDVCHWYDDESHTNGGEPWLSRRISVGELASEN
jgi:hypothetical protein